MGAVRAALLSAGLFSLGCEDRPPLPPVVFEGEHIRYRTFERADDLCPGSFFVQDDKAGYLKEVFGTDPVVDFSWVPDHRYFDYCPAPDGCSVGSEVFSQRPVHEHELVHGVRESAFLPLEEGLAVYFGDGTSREENDRAAIDVMLDKEVDGSDYAKLGRFVSFLASEFGTQQLVMLADSTSRGSRDAEVATAFDQQLGVSLQDLAAEFDADYPVCPVVNFRDDAPFCAQSPTVELTTGVDAPTVEHVFELSCSDDKTQGSRSGRRWRYETLHVPERTAYLMTVSPQPSELSSLVVLEPCDKSCFDDKPSSYRDRIENEVVCLDRGTYLLRIALDGDDGSFRFSAAPAGWC